MRASTAFTVVAFLAGSVLAQPAQPAQSRQRGPYAPGESWTPDAKWTVTGSTCRIAGFGS